MNPSEESFVRGIKERVHTRAYFRLAVKEGLYRFMGETPAEVLFLSIGDAALDNPALFVKELSRMFGKGSVPICNAVLKVAEQPSWLAQRETQAAEIMSAMSAHDPSSTAESQDRRTTFLHDHRIRDNFSEEDAR
jgi:hypothetical protein